MSILATTSATATPATTAATTAASGNSPATDPAQAQDRFLKLLVAQLNNQDPMNPMDNAQMTSQMAQINTVTGIQQLNDTMKSMNAQFSSLQGIQNLNTTMTGLASGMQSSQALQASSLVGRTVEVESKTAYLDSGGTVRGRHSAPRQHSVRHECEAVSRHRSSSV